MEEKMKKEKTKSLCEPEDPAAVITSMIRSHSDLLRLRDNLAEQIERSHCYP
jgi:hypothetical protein